MFTAVLVHIVSIYIVLVLCHNEIHHCEPFGSLSDAEDKAISLANDWHIKDGVRSFGLDEISTVGEMIEYHGSDTYLDSGDSAYVCIKKIPAIT